MATPSFVLREDSKGDEVTIEIGTTGLWVADLQASEHFYVNGLGLSVVARIETADYQEIIVAQPERGFQLMLAVSKHRSHAAPPQGIWKVFLFSDDVERDFERAVAAGATPIKEPTVLESIGFSIAIIEDIDGFTLELGQRLAIDPSSLGGS